MSPYLILTLLYFSLRIPFIWQIPLFEDEALFTGWSLEISKNLGNAALPLTSGIAPLFSWLTFIFLPVTANQFLAGRIVSLLAGWLLSLCLYFCLDRVLRLPYSLFLTILYIFLPITIVYNRLALLDTLMVLFSFICVLISIAFLNSFSKKIAISYFLVLTLAILSKQIGIISIPAVIAGYIYVTKKIKKEFFLLSILSVASLVTVSLLYLPFRRASLSFLYDYIFIPTNFNQSFIHIKKNSWLTWHWLISYYSPIFILATLFGGLLALVRGSKKVTYLTVVFAVFFLTIIITSKLYFPRHTLVFAPFMIIFISVFCQNLTKISKSLVLSILGVLLMVLLYSDWQLLKFPASNKVMAKEDIFQLYQDWTSGRRLPEIADYLADKKNKFTVLTI